MEQQERIDFAEHPQDYENQKMVEEEEENEGQKEQHPSHQEQQQDLSVIKESVPQQTEVDDGIVPYQYYKSGVIPSPTQAIPLGMVDTEQGNSEERQSKPELEPKFEVIIPDICDIEIVCRLSTPRVI